MKISGLLKCGVTKGHFWVAFLLVATVFIPDVAFCSAINGSVTTSPSKADLELTGLPADSGVLNVRDFGAKGDGVTDDTAAILKAIAASGANNGYFIWQDQIVYFPNGTYLISAPLVKRYADGSFACGMVLVGQSEDKTILKLKDHAPGYENTKAPKAMIFPTSKLLDRSGPYGGNKDYPAKGEGNDAYKNNVENMTVDAGVGNPGAIGIDYLANNIGAIRHVTVTAPAGSGAIGVALTRKWIGPALIDHLTVKGFLLGIDVASTNYGITLNHVYLNGQVGAGLRNNHNVVVANDLEINAQGPAIINLAGDGQIILAQSKLASSSGTTVQNTAGTIVFRASHSTNAQAFAHSKTSEEQLDGYLTGTDKWTSLKDKAFMPVVDAPEVVHDPISKWVSVTSFGAVPIATNDPTGKPIGTPVDSLKAFQAAFASGASTIYLPHGIYYVSKNLEIPDTVKRIVGMNSSLRVFQGGGYLVNRAQGLIRLISTAPGVAPLQIESIGIDNNGFGTQQAIEDSSPRTLVIQDVTFAGAIMMNRTATGGPLFLSDTNSGGKNRIAGPAPVTALQINMEGCDVCMINDGSPLNIVNVKTERDVTVVDTRGGGRTQVLGGFLYIVLINPNPDKPAFRVTDSDFDATFVEQAFGQANAYVYYVTVTNHGKVSIIQPMDYPVRGARDFGHIVPWMEVTKQ